MIPPKVVDLSDCSVQDMEAVLESTSQQNPTFGEIEYLALSAACSQPGWGLPYTHRKPIGTVFQNAGGRAEMPERPETKRDRQRAKRRQKRSK